MNKNSEVVTGHSKIAAHLIFASLLKEHSLQQASIFFWEFVESLANSLLELVPCDRFKDTHTRIGNGIHDFGISRELSSPRSVMLMQYIVAHRVDEGSEAFWLTNSLFGQKPQHTREGLLPNIFDSGN